MRYIRTRSTVAVVAALLCCCLALVGCQSAKPATLSSAMSAMTPADKALAEASRAKLGAYTKSLRGVTAKDGEVTVWLTPQASAKGTAEFQRQAARYLASDALIMGRTKSVVVRDGADKVVRQ